MVSITIVVGAFAFVWGIFALVASIKADKRRRWVRILEGVCGIYKIVGGFALPKGDPSKGLLC